MVSNYTRMRTTVIDGIAAINAHAQSSIFLSSRLYTEMSARCQ